MVNGADRKPPERNRNERAQEHSANRPTGSSSRGLLAVAASVLREKKETVDLTTQQIEDAISALDPGTRAAVIARLTADAVQQVKDHVDR